LQLLCQDWIPAFAGMTANENTGMALPGPVIPAKAGIQTKQSTISNMALPGPVIPAKAGIQTKQSTISNNVYTYIQDPGLVYDNLNSISHESASMALS